jgi:hypothetical protein
VKKEIHMSKERDSGCDELATQRLRYFTGRHMTARDFRDEQAYHRTHRLLHNRMLHGWGVVCGLHVDEHPLADCRADRVKVRCGFALDCCGREVAVPKDVVPPPIPWKDRHGEDERYLLLCLEYCQSETERVPVLYSEQGCDPQRRENGRIDESYCFKWHWLKEEDLPKYHWRTRGGGCPEGSPCPDDDCDDGEGPRRCCLQPDCPPHHCIPLALITGSDGKVAKDDIDMDGRPSLEPPQHALTHICSINWPHGGTLTRDQLEHDLGGKLRVRFDRRLRHEHGEEPCGPSGVNACTFEVKFGGGHEDVDFVPFYRAPHAEHDCTAVYTIHWGDHDPRYRRRYGYLEGQIVYVTLKCDFILDCHGVAVDGNHIGGRLPSGDGVLGGTFESWFRVVSGDEYSEEGKTA